MRGTWVRAAQLLGPRSLRQIAAVMPASSSGCVTWAQVMDKNQQSWKSIQSVSVETRLISPSTDLKGNLWWWQDDSTTYLLYATVCVLASRSIFHNVLSEFSPTLDKSGCSSFPLVVLLCVHVCWQLRFSTVRPRASKKLGMVSFLSALVSSMSRVVTALACLSSCGLDHQNLQFSH